LSLFDELIHVPLLFVGNSIKPEIIEKQVRHVDICSIIYDQLGIVKTHKKQGQKLTSSSYNTKENMQYLHTMPYQKLSISDMVGIRTEDYKYFRFARNSNENVHLYDLKKDPYENENIADTNKELILQFEKNIIEFEKNDLSNDEDELSEEELKKISGELKKLGYM
jgi:arylsulfatase A-like enzyme